MKASGVINRILRRYLPAKEAANCRQEASRPLGFNNVTVPFTILILGLALSILFSIMEKIFLYSQERRSGSVNKQNDKREFLLRRIDLLLKSSKSIEDKISGVQKLLSLALRGKEEK